MVRMKQNHGGTGPRYRMILGTAATAVVVLPIAAGVGTPIARAVVAVGQPCSSSDDAKLAYDAAGQQVFCKEGFAPPGWSWQPAPPMIGVHVTGSACDGEAAYTMSRSTDGYLIECVPPHLGNPGTAPQGSIWEHASDL